MNVQQHGNNQRNSNVYYSRNHDGPAAFQHRPETTTSSMAEKLELSAPASPRRCASPRRRKQTATSRRGKRVSGGGESVEKSHVLNTIPMVFAADKKDDMESPQRRACDPPGMLSNDLSSFLHKDAEKTKKRASKKRSKPKPSDTATVVTWIRCSDSVASKVKNSTYRRNRIKREDLHEPAIVLPNEARRGMPSSKQHRADDAPDHTSYTTTSSSSRRSDDTQQEKPNSRRKSKLKSPKKESSSSRRNKSSSSLNSGGKREKTKRIAMDAAAAANTLFRPAYSENPSSAFGGEEYFHVSPRKAAFATAISESSSKRRGSSTFDGHGSNSNRKLSMIAPAKANNRRVSLKGSAQETPRSKKRTSVVATNQHLCTSSALPLDFSDFENDDFSVHNNAADDNGGVDEQQQNSFAVSIDGVVQW